MSALFYQVRKTVRSTTDLEGKFDVVGQQVVQNRWSVTVQGIVGHHPRQLVWSSRFSAFITGHLWTDRTHLYKVSSRNSVTRSAEIAPKISVW